MASFTKRSPLRTLSRLAGPGDGHRAIVYLLPDQESIGGTVRLMTISTGQDIRDIGGVRGNKLGRGKAGRLAMPITGRRPPIDFFQGYEHRAGHGG